MPWYEYIASGSVNCIRHQVLCVSIVIRGRGKCKKQMLFTGSQGVSSNLRYSVLACVVPGIKPPPNGG